MESHIVHVTIKSCRGTQPNGIYQISITHKYCMQPRVSTSFIQNHKTLIFSKKFDIYNINKSRQNNLGFMNN